MMKKTSFVSFKPGLYPIVDSSEWVELLGTCGARCIQLRIKNLENSYLEQEIARSISIAKQYGITLFINDYWQLSLDLGADGVHLGQEDLLTANIEAIYNAGLYLGVSTHSAYEIANAQALNPSYIAFGPIYSTTSKEMSFQPQGINQLHYWKKNLDCPIVAIGGITLERIPEVLKTGVDGIALISAITKAENPRANMQQLMRAYYD